MAPVKAKKTEKVKASSKAPSLEGKTKPKVGADGKTKQQRYVQRYRSKVYAANAERKREARERKKIDDVSVLMQAAKTPHAPPPRLYNIRSSRAESAIVKARESLGESAASSAISPQLIKKFDELKKRFDRWEKDSKPVILKIYSLHSIRRGWLGEGPFLDSELENVMYEHLRVAKKLYTKSQEMVRKLSFEVAGHSDRWEIALDIFTATVTSIVLINNIIDGYNGEPDPAPFWDGLPPSSPPSDWEPPAGFECDQ